MPQSPPASSTGFLLIMALAVGAWLALVCLLFLLTR